MEKERVSGDDVEGRDGDGGRCQGEHRLKRWKNRALEV